MRYRVIVSPEALSDLRTIRSRLKAFAPRAALGWYSGVRKRIATLAEHPERCALAPESTFFLVQIRELLYGQPNRKMYRILFTVEGKLVVVLHVRHGSRLEWDGL